MSDLNMTANEDIYNVINKFLKDTCITSDFTCERIEENKNNKNKDKDKEKNNNSNLDSKTIEININSHSEINNNSEDKKSDSNPNNNIAYYVGFPSPDIAFDFNRYMNSLRLINPTFKNIKIQVLLSKKKSHKINDELNDNNKKNYQMNYNYRYGTTLNYEEQDLDKRNIEILNVIKIIIII